MSREPDNHEPADANLDRLLTMAESPPQLDPEARARLLARLQRSAVDLKKTPTPASGGPTPMSPRNRPTFARLAAYTLSIAAAGALAWTGYRFFAAERDPSAVSPDSYALHRNDGQRPLTVTLADGSTAILRAGAAVQQHGPRRLELVEGEVLLDVVPGEGTFKITAAAGDIEVRGTKFLLRQQDRAELIAGVLRGEVRLFNGAGEAILHAGEAGKLSPGTAPQRHQAERLSHEVAWARDALVDPTDELKAVRRGNLLARFPNWEGREWPLPVRSMDVDVYVENGVARTTIDQTFFNTTNFELEGVYSFPLPADAAISRLAMYVDGKLMEAGITERQEGREIYESIVYRRRDPALLEWMQGNQFRVRVFPLPARTEKRILLSYTQPLASLYGDYSVRVPIPEYDVPVETLRYRVHVKDKTLKLDSCCVEFAVSDVGDERLAEATLRNAALGEDLALTLYPSQKPPEAGLAVQPDPGGDYVMARVRPTLPQSSQHVPRRWVVLHDTSASRSPAELAAQTRFLKAALKELDEADRLTLLAFDSTLRSLPGGFRRVDELDLGAVDGFLARENREHVGATELARAVDHALGLFAEDAGPEAPHILYVGDGLVSDRSDAGRTALRERLQGKATFVAAAVGDETDAGLLADLAGATGGLHVQLTPGGDLGWQALDLAAALNTARLQNIRVSLRDAGDAEYAARVHLSATSLSDGEALVALTRRTGAAGPVPSAMVVEGTLAGAPWSQRFDLPKPAGDAAYLPRLWARAQVEADVRAGAEAHKAEITALGMQHFLVTPFTSLLVLENEAMYRQFKVRRPSDKDWAHYDAPAEIEVVRERLGIREPAPGTLVQRRPIGLLGNYNRYQYGGFDDAIGGGWFSPGQGNIGLSGLGLTGFGRGGGGVGEGTIGLGSTGLIGAGGGGTGSGYGRGSGAGFGGRGTRVPSVRTGDFTLGGLKSTETPPMLTKASFVTTSELARSNDWSRDSLAGPMRPDAETRTLDLEAGFRGRAAQRRSAHFSSGGLAYPTALHHVGDHRLGDLGEHLPALFEDGFDRERERLLATTADIPGGSISPEARELLAAARDRVKTTSYATDDGVLRVEAGGRFTRARTIGRYLRELVVYDGETLSVTYPDLDLRVVRRVGLAEPALLAQWVPWLLPSPDNLARWYTVTRVGDGTLRLALHGQPDTIDLELDASRDLVAVRHRRGDELIGEQTFEHAADGVTIVADGKRTRAAATTQALDLAGGDVATTLQLPLRGDADLTAALAETTPGAPAWRDVQRQRLAVLAALQQYGQIPAVLQEMLAHGPLTRGELVLGGAGIKSADDKVAGRLLAGHADDPVAAYLAALRKTSRGQSAAIAQVAKAHAGTLPGLLASHATILADGARAGTPASQERLRSFLTTYDHPDLAYIATYQAARMNDWRRPLASAGAWETLAATRPEWQTVAWFGAGQAYWRGGKQSEAADRFERSLTAAAELGQTPVVDWSVRSAVQSSRGQAGWRMLWNRWRAAVQKSGDVGQLMALVTAAQQLGEPGEIHRALVGADRSKLDPASGGQLVQVLLNADQISDAQVVLRGLLQRSPDDPATLELASRVAERQGRLDEAADLADRALAGAGDLPLDRLRNAYRRLLDLRVRLAESIDQPDPKTRSQQTGRAPLDAALDVAARWRAEDPDNKEIDERCSALLFTLGQPDEAVRHLDSVVERHPGEGDAYAAVAGALEREGRFADADRRWQQAIAVEPTNPTWLISRAHNLLTSGDTAGARALAEQVKAGKWQDRFSGSEYEARELLRQLDTHRR